MAPVVFKKMEKRSITIWEHLFAEYTVLPEVSLAKVSKDAPLDKICLLGL